MITASHAGSSPSRRQTFPGSGRLAGWGSNNASGLWPGRSLAGGGRGRLRRAICVDPAGSLPAGKTTCSMPVRRASPTVRGHRRHRHPGVATRWRRAAHLIPGAPAISPCWRPPPLPTTWRGWWRAGAGRPCPPICCWSPALKTADIQQTLAYGAHGPSRLLVVLVEDC